jgi:preprotein translocase subunit YajC
MNILFSTPAYAEEAAGGVESFLVGFGPLIFFVIIFYFLLIRPQQKTAKIHREMLAKLEKGDEVITSSGIHGKVLAVKEDSVQLEIAENVRIKLQKSAVQLRKPRE